MIRLSFGESRTSWACMLSFMKLGVEAVIGRRNQLEQIPARVYRRKAFKPYNLFLLIHVTTLL